MKHTLSVLGCALVAFSLVSMPAPAHAAITSAGVNGRAIGVGVIGDVAYDDKHQVYLHVYEGRTGANIPVVFGVFIGFDGVQRGAVFQVSPASGASYANKPRVAYSSAAGDDIFLVTYTSDFATGGANMRGQLVAEAGLSGGSFPVSQLSLNAGVFQRGTDLIFNPNIHMFLAVWDDGRNSTDVAVRHVSTAGVPQGTDILVSNAPFSQGAATAAYDPVNHRYAVGYQGVSPTSPASGPEITGAWAKILDDNLALQTDLITVSAGGTPIEFGTEYLPERGGFMIYWTGFTSSRDVQARIISPAGAFLTGVYPLIATTLNEGNPAARYNGGSKSTLVAAMSDLLFLRGVELDGLGIPSQGASFNLTTVNPSPGGSFNPRIASGPAMQWGVQYEINHNFTVLERFSGTLVTATGGGTTSPPPPPPPPPATKVLPVSDPDATTSSAASGAQTLYLQSDSGQLGRWALSNFGIADGSLLNPGQLADPNWQIVGSGDVNHDGMPDIFWSHRQTGALAVWLMNGMSLMESRMLTPDHLPSTSWRVVSTKDMNADGDPDLVLQHTNGNVAIWFLHGTAIWDGAMLPFNNTDPAWKVVGAADLNADGWNDLVWQRTDGSIATWSMRGATFLEGQLLSPGRVTDTNWEIRGVTDVNGDGKPDLVWQHKTNNWLAVTPMNGITIIDSVFMNPDTLAAGWHIVGPR
jgi:hypothetical protein